MDALSEVLKTFRVEGAVFLNAEFSAPWCIWSSFGLANVKDRLASADQLLYFHFLVDGSCKLGVGPGRDVIDAAAGDLILFPCDERHLMGTDLRLAPVEAVGLPQLQGPDEGDFIQMRHGGGGTPTRLVCGYIACSRTVCRPLLQGLPKVVRLPVGDGLHSSLVHELLKAGVRQSSGGKPGAASTLAKLSELMVVEALRRYVGTLPADRQGWLAGIADPHVGRVLALIHAQPGRGWTVDTLARAVAMSRSGLATRFSGLVGQSPIQYLTQWRMALAADVLLKTRQPVVKIAQDHGYDSEAAFNRAFKRAFQVPPATWRRTGTAPPHQQPEPAA